jgi:hypothetical protein
MRVTWNGTGSAWSRRYGNSSALIESESDGGTRLLIDCGHTVPARLEELGVSLRDIDAVFISHLHGDHIYGLEEWGFKNLLLWDARPTLLIAEDLAAPLWANVLSGTMAQVCNRSCLLDDYFEVVRLQVGKPVSVGPFTLEIRPVRHVPNAASYGCRVAGDALSLGFTCDSLADVDSWFYDGTDAVFHDCSFSPPFAETVHAHFEELRRYPEDWRRRTRLVHYSDEVETLRQNPAFANELAESRFRICEPLRAYEAPGLRS